MFGLINRPSIHFMIGSQGFICGSGVMSSPYFPGVNKLSAPRNCHRAMGVKVAHKSTMFVLVIPPTASPFLHPISKHEQHPTCLWRWPSLLSPATGFTDQIQLYFQSCTVHLLVKAPLPRPPLVLCGGCSDQTASRARLRVKLNLVSKTGNTVRQS